MHAQVLVNEEIFPGKIAVAFAPGATEALFRAQYADAHEGPWTLTDYLATVRYADNRDWRYTTFHQGVGSLAPPGWKILFPDQISLSTKYDFMDWLVAHFDAAVDWRAYQLELENLRTRRERLRQWRAHKPAGKRHAQPATAHVPRSVVQAYRILRCDVGADKASVARAYKQMSLQHHPDRGGSEQHMVQINKAMAVLRDFFEGQHAHTR